MRWYAALPGPPFPERSTVPLGTFVKAAGGGSSGSAAPQTTAPQATETGPEV